MKPYIAAAHAVIHPSFSEGMSNVCQEHGAMGGPASQAISRLPGNCGRRSHRISVPARRGGGPDGKSPAVHKASHTEKILMECVQERKWSGNSIGRRSSGLIWTKFISRGKTNELFLPRITETSRRKKREAPLYGTGCSAARCRIRSPMSY